MTLFGTGGEAEAGKEHVLVVVAWVVSESEPNEGSAGVLFVGTSSKVSHTTRGELCGESPLLSSRGGLVVGADEPYLDIFSVGKMTLRR
jgi:hypothetical protein